MSKHSRPRKRLTMPRFKSPGVIVMIFALVAGIFGFAGPAAATGGGDNTECITWEWQRDVVPQVTEMRYKKSVEDTNTQYHFAKFTRTKTKSADVWQNFSPNKDQGPFEGPPAWPSDPRGTWQHENKPIPPGQQGPDGVYQNGSGNGSWFYRAAGVWSDYGPWTKWSPETHTSWQDSTDPLGSPAFHGEGTYSDGTKWYRQWQARFDGQTREVSAGSHWVYYVAGSAPSTNKGDASWVTESPGGDWVKFDTRTVDGESVHQGPVRSADEPDRGDYPDVAWTKVEGSEQNDCTTPEPSTPEVSVGQCVEGNTARDVVTTGTFPQTTFGGTTAFVVNGDAQISDDQSYGTVNGPWNYTFVVQLAAGEYDSIGVKFSGGAYEGFETLPVEKFTVGECDDTPPPGDVIKTKAPTFVDVCEPLEGDTNDAYTIPSKKGLVYKVNGVVTEAGTYPGVGTVKVTVEPVDENDSLKGKSKWRFTFTKVECDSQETVDVVGDITHQCVRTDDGALTGMTEATISVKNRGNTVQGGDVTEVIDGGTPESHPFSLQPGEELTLNPGFTQENGKHVDLVLNGPADSVLDTDSFDTADCAVATPPEEPNKPEEPKKETPAPEKDTPKVAAPPETDQSGELPELNVGLLGFGLAALLVGVVAGVLLFGRRFARD